MRGIARKDSTDDQLFAFLVGYGDQIRLSFELDELVAGRIVIQNVSGSAGQIDRRFQVLRYRG
jgi:hypothetical protein